MSRNRLYYGDNLDVLRRDIASESVDLVYLDPPFNSNRSYNVIFTRRDVKSPTDAAQIQAFDDTWHWTPTTGEQYRDAVTGGLPSGAADALRAFRTLLGENDAMAYLVNMAPRLVELYRVLKPSGLLYLHADPTMSHYLKILLDAIFGADRFRNDISWERSSTRSSISKIYRRAHDCILCFAKSENYTFNLQYRELAKASKAAYSKEDSRGVYRAAPLLVSGKRNGDTGQPWRGIDPNARGKAGMHWVTVRANLETYDEKGLILWPAKPGGLPQLKYYADQTLGVPLSDMWDDIKLISPQSKEGLGYPTQKPIALLERIISASSNPGAVVLDPFCGCGTTIDAAQRLNRRWIGIDITYIAVDLIEKRLLHTYGDSIRAEYEVSGIPRDLSSAQALFRRSPFDFERWAVSLVNGQPNARQVGDRGVDGVVGFNIDTKGNIGRVLVSVKGGHQIGPQFVRDLVGTVQTQHAEMGLLVTMTPPTRGMHDAADHSGTYRWPVNGQTFPRVQIATVEQLLAGRVPKMPPALLPYIAARRGQAASTQMAFEV